MGGGGDGYFQSDPKTILQRLRESEEKTQSKQHETEIARVLSSFLTKFNDRDNEKVNQHLVEIKKALERDIEGTVDLLYGGSVAKHTYIDGLSDIDSLVILNNSELSNKSPEVAKEYFAKRLQERFPKHDVKIGRLAVTITFSGAEIQLLPAVSQHSHVKIADKTGSAWARIKPKDFAKVLTTVNQNMGGKVIPVVKLAKAVIACLPQKHRISGYHAESLAIQIFRNYGGEIKPKFMLKHYFKEASELVRRPILDRTGQSVHVDEHLGIPNSLERKIVSDAFSRVYRRMNNADNAQSIDEWKKLFEGLDK